MSNEIKTVLDGAGITSQWILEQMKGMAASDSTKPDVRYQILKDLARLKGMDIENGKLGLELPPQGEEPKKLEQFDDH